MEDIASAEDAQWHSHRTTLQQNQAAIKQKPVAVLDDLPTAEINFIDPMLCKSQFKIVGLPSADYPAMPAIERQGLIPFAGVGFDSF